ncbi:hypothetical protein [Legionella antarctica]|uniref:hypothetical protein n=1 Tax=Legionella antarctica TaxID=2708020 RepID=UPI0018D628DF|nr:hypothetical protein [Legionella antarctica]
MHADLQAMEEELLKTMKLLEQEAEKTEAKQEQSPTLTALDAARRPKIKTACETCPNSMWFSSPQEVKCYCRVMHLISWSAKESNLITMCDGKLID